jgi:TIM-barrel protein
MAGINDGNFCRVMTKYGFDMVTLGGYNIDKETIRAGKSIIQRGRPEFDIKEGEILNTITKQASIIKNGWDGKVSVNLRSKSTDPMVKISRIKDIDIVEVNAHCRQPEITEIGCGQALLYNTEILYNFTKNIVKKAESKVSVKIRANIEDVNDIEVSKAIEDAGAHYLHVDAMKPGFNHADLDVIKKIKKNTDIFLIGNNSIRDLKSARDMLSTGVDGISIARAAIKGSLAFDLSSL